MRDLARQKARAAQHTFMRQDVDEVNDEERRAVLREIVEKAMNSPTPEQAAAAEEEVFATRYKNDFTATTGSSRSPPVSQDHGGSDGHSWIASTRVLYESGRELRTGVSWPGSKGSSRDSSRDRPNSLE